MEVDLKIAQKESFFEVMKILRENAEWMLSKKIEQWPLDWLESMEPEIYLSVKSGNFFFAMHEERVVGVVEILSKPERIWKYDKSQAIYIHKLAIKRENSGLGVGANIISKLLSWSAKNERSCIRLDCVANNVSLRKYYERNGFKFISVKNNGLVELALYEKRINA